MSDYEVDLPLYGWTDENIRLTREMCDHIKDRFNNSLAIILSSTDNDVVKEEALRMVKYIEFLETRVK